jgi:hypothetical protein
MNATGFKRLSICVIAGAIIWLLVLPWISRQEPVKSMIRRNQSAGIDPSAMFYTELDHLTYEAGMLRKRSH